MDIFGIYLNGLKYSELFSKITRFDKQNIVFTPNPEILLKTKNDKEFKNILVKASYLVPDGIGLYIAFQMINFDFKILKIIVNIILMPYYIFNIFFRRKYLYKKYGDRICGSDLTLDLVKFAEKNDVKITIIDLYNPTDEKKIASQKNFPEKLKQKFQNLNFDYFIYNTEEKENIIEKISKSDSKILFSTLGMKTQEQSIFEIMDKAKNIKLGLGIGSSFDYIVGFQKRAPKIFRNFGFERLYRIFTGPQKIKRLKRLYNATFVFIFNALKN